MFSAPAILGLPETLGEIEFAVAGCVPRLRPAYRKRRLDFWVKQLVLPSLGPVHTGSGHRRAFHPETKYYAALLLKIAQFGSNVEILKAIVQQIITALQRDDDFCRLWEEAKELRNAELYGPVWAVIGIALGDDGDKPAATWVRLKHAEGRHYHNAPGVDISPVDPLVPDYLITVKLTDTFHGMRRIG
jgi:hypothetical protein